MHHDMCVKSNHNHYIMHSLSLQESHPLSTITNSPIKKLPPASLNESKSRGMSAARSLSLRGKGKQDQLQPRRSTRLSQSEKNATTAEGPATAENEENCQVQ